MKAFWDMEQCSIVEAVAPMMEAARTSEKSVSSTRLNGAISQKAKY
jgi:hypothetical protein